MNALCSYTNTQTDEASHGAGILSQLDEESVFKVCVMQLVAAEHKLCVHGSIQESVCYTL